MSKEEIEAKGYTYVEEINIRYNADLHNRDVYGVLVWKDGFYGLLDIRTGEEITPCVHLSRDRVIADVHVLKSESKDRKEVKRLGIQKVLKDSLGEKLYDPYIGSIVSLMFEILALPNSVYYIDMYYQDALDEEQFKTAAIRIYEAVAKLLVDGGKKFIIYDYGIDREFEQFCKKLEEEINKDLNNPEEGISILPALYQLIALRKFYSNAFNMERTGYFHMQKPAIDIKPEGTVYHPDLHNQEEAIEISREAFARGVPVELPEEEAKLS